jgi:hypothetical protein
MDQATKDLARQADKEFFALYETLEKLQQGLTYPFFFVISATACSLVIIDTQRGLNAFVQLLQKIYKPHPEE